ncbi:hypothetical protein LSCM1_02299 [Leishmania martiniquensis]|uniref:Uncharacterized protein n=1 Tax=Leishmania martiniquensis TaxID=1580590 RepID=A0A836K9J4_9TRYP|nr:hypothetical protein LSCM1_02299 [Leishmania martiniquensis]
MVRQHLSQVLVRTPPTRARAESHSIDSAPGGEHFPGFAVIGAAAGDSSAVIADEASRCKRVPALPTTPKRAKGWNAAGQLRRGSSGSSAVANLRRARVRYARLPSVRARGNSVGERSDNAHPLHQSRRPMSATVTCGLPRMHSVPCEAVPTPGDGLTSEDLLLLCGVQPGSSKALWYTTMRAQLEARALVSTAEHGDRIDATTAKKLKPGATPPLSSNLQATRANPCSEPLVLPSKLFWLTGPSERNPLWNLHKKAAALPVARQTEKVASASSSDDSAGEVKEDEREDDGASSLGTRSTSLSSEKVSKASSRKGPPNAPPLPSLKKLRLSPKQRQQLHVSVLSLQALAGG